MPIMTSKINLSFIHPDEHDVDWIDDVVNRVGIKFNKLEKKDQVKSEADKKSLVSSDLFARMEILYYMLYYIQE